MKHSGLLGPFQAFWDFVGPFRALLDFGPGHFSGPPFMQVSI